MRAAAAADSPPVTRAFRVLFVTPYVPSRLRPRPLHMVKGLKSRGHRVTLVAAATDATEARDVAALEPFCERVHAVRIPLLRSLWNCACGVVGPAPLQARYCVSPAMTTVVRNALAESGPDVVHVEHLRAALYGIPITGLPRVYDAVDCMSGLLAQTATAGPTLTSRLTARAELARTRRFEASLLDHFDAIALSASTERDAWLEALPAGQRGRAAERVRVVSNCVDTDYFSAADVPRDPATLVFVGRMGYHANFAAARRLIGEIMPRVWARRADARLVIVGADPPAALRALATEAGSRVEVTGYVADVRPYLARATVSVSPLDYAVGTQNKILEAMATATPVVATPAGSAGLDATPGQHLLVAADADGIAAAVLQLLDDPALARRLGTAGRQCVEARYDLRAVARVLESLYADAIASFSPVAAALASAGAA